MLTKSLASFIVTSMTPSEIYRSKLASGAIDSDPIQWQVLTILDTIFDALLKEHEKRKSIFAFMRAPITVKGVYLWGGVGIGKTFLMDCFYQAIPFKEKQRQHFHSFMQYVHKQLKLHQGKKNPLDIIAKEFARTTMLLCFDELFVNEITDAMILARLFRALFDNGVCIVLTSNTAPDDLYMRGLQRQQFVPAIDLLKKYTKVFHLTSTIDYRLRLLKAAGVFYTPNDAYAQQQMTKLFDKLAAGHEQRTDALEILDRKIDVIKFANDIVWFDFNVLCSPPRSQLDYLEIVKRFHIIFLSNIPAIKENDHNRITLFIRFIDVLYDAHRQLVFASDQPIGLIYAGGRMSQDFKRTQSRLLEMQTEKYYKG